MRSVVAGAAHRRGPSSRSALAGRRSDSKARGVLRAAAALPGPNEVMELGGGYLPARCLASSAGPAGGMASGAITLARWVYLLYGGWVLGDQALAAMTTSRMATTASGRRTTSPASASVSPPLAMRAQCVATPHSYCALASWPAPLTALRRRELPSD